jgi:hypothetical protein
MKDKLIKLLDFLGLTEALVLAFIAKFGAKGLAALIKKSSSTQDDKASIVFCKEFLSEMNK